MILYFSYFLSFLIIMSDGCVRGPKFRLLGPSDSVLCQLPAATVNLTALLYVPQLASLAIGYSFGAFQLYNLHTMSIE